MKIISENELRMIINEELGIALEVSQKAEEVLNSIKEDIKNSKGENKEDYVNKKGKILFEFVGCKMRCSYHYMSFNDKTMYEYSLMKDNSLNDGWSIFLDKKTVIMNVRLCGISGWVDEKNAIDTISHELEHIYQQIRMGKSFSDVSHYQKIENGLNSKNKNIYKASRLLYGCLKTEQEGFVNGLYSYIMMLIQPKINSIDEIKENECIRLYNEMVAIYNESLANDNLKKEILKYGYSLKNIRKFMNNFIKKIGRVIIKAEKDKILYQGWRN